MADGTRIDQFLQRAFALAGTSEAETLYDEWASGYDADLHGRSYASPRRSVVTIMENVLPLPNENLKILDAGCGTGLVGDCLAQSQLAKKFVLDGVDLSAGMLAIAREKGTYRELMTANLNDKIEKPDGSYDVVVCVGTLTKGHVGPAVLTEFTRLVVMSGLVVATVLDEMDATPSREKIEFPRDETTVNGLPFTKWLIACNMRQFWRDYASFAFEMMLYSMMAELARNPKLASVCAGTAK
ncbi:Methyltransferase-like protein 27 [Paramyrothecium foliicola]|nr:Methyltransferase-like protein 27 [Paramyrothecium foliicola]